MKLHPREMAVPDPDLEIRAGGHPDPLETKGWGGGGRSPKTFFSALRASAWFKNKEGGGPATEWDLVRVICVPFTEAIL